MKLHLLTTFVTLAAAQICLPGTPNYDSLQCKICGYEGSDPLRCQADEAKFDDIPTNTTTTPSLSPYRLATYTNFYATSRNTSNPIKPSSGTQYIRTDASGRGVMSITGNGDDYNDPLFWWQPWGHLVSFKFACADPCTTWSSGQAVDCSLKVTAICYQTVLNYSAESDASSEYYEYGPERIESNYSFSNTFSFSVPEGLGTPTKPAPMSNTSSWASFEKSIKFPNGTQEVVLQTFPEYTMNYTFEAKQSDGRPAFLYLDDVIYNAWHSMG